MSSGAGECSADCEVRVVEVVEVGRGKRKVFSALVQGQEGLEGVIVHRFPRLSLRKCCVGDGVGGVNDRGVR